MTSEEPANLAQIQAWMQAVITHPAGVWAGLQSPQANEHLQVEPETLENMISRSQALSSAERLNVYANAYHLRLLECLREEYTITAQAIGQETFEGLAFGYLQTYPSHSYTLGQLGSQFPRYLSETRLHAAAAPSSPAHWPDVIIELATFERAIHEVFDGPGIEHLPPPNWEPLWNCPPDQWSSLRLSPAPCLRLLHFQHSLNDYYTSLRDETPAPFPTATACYLALHRLDFRVRRFELTRPQFSLLASLAYGHNLGDALAETFSQLAEETADEATFAAQLREWFALWTSQTFFCGVKQDGMEGAANVKV